MDAGTQLAVGILGVTGALLLAVAIASLRTGGAVRRLYGIDDADDAGARSNALVLGLVGVGLIALAGGIAADVSERAIGAASVLAAGLLCVGLGWLVRYRDRRELLTTPNVSQERGRKLGAAAIACGVVILPLAPLIWIEASEAVLVTMALGVSIATLVLVAPAYSL